MKFDLKKAVKNSEAKKELKKLALLLLGPSGGGKSGTIGTMGVKTLYLFSNAERHGLPTACEYGKDIIPLQYDIHPETGEPLNPDQTLEFLTQILSDLEFIKDSKIECVALDGLSELESIIIQSVKWKALVDANYKGNQSFAGPVTLGFIRPILAQLNVLQDKLNIHYIVTSILNVQETDIESGLIIEGSPSMKGFQVASDVVRTFSDILIVGQMVSPSGNSKPRIQFTSNIGKVAKDFQTKQVTKILNCTPRLSGLDVGKLSAHVSNDLSKIVKFKETGEYNK